MRTGSLGCGKPPGQRKLVAVISKRVQPTNHRLVQQVSPMTPCGVPTHRAWDRSALHFDFETVVEAPSVDELVNSVVSHHAARHAAGAR